MNKLMTVNCSICKKDESNLIRIIRGFRIVKCKNCGFLYTNPRYVWDYENSTGVFQNKLLAYQQHYLPKRKLSAHHFWEEAENYRQIGALLEVGCGYGFFLNDARIHGWSVTGVEIAHDEAEWGQKQFDLTILPSIDELQLTGQKFDIIALWDVIEHIPNIFPLLQHCFNLLRPGGILVLKTPNAEGLMIMPTWWSWIYLQFYWQLVYPANPIEHIHHFTPGVMKKLLSDHGFIVQSLEIRQGWNERILIGRNWVVTLVKTFLMWIAWKAHLPYEMTIWAKKN
ncbi:MAG: methyltransferase domain-containing protein [Chloroflexi bacterium]|nr:methyltransferase domain-containing protein [Chloroflexota bacterium]